MSGEDNNGIEITKEKIEEAIKNLLSLAYEGLKEPKYIGYPTSDLIQCFLDAETAVKGGFQRMLDEAVPEYKGDWEGFKGGLIEKRLNEILDELVTLKVKEGTGKLTKSSEFDETSGVYRLMSNISIASSLFTIFYYISRGNKDWISGESKKEKLKKGITGLINSRIDKNGWQYFNTGKGAISGVLPTWLSILALKYIPEEIIKEMDMNEEINTIKTEVGEWLIASKEEYQEGENKFYSWSFQPEREEGKSNPIATAQAILALRALKPDGIDEIVIGSVNYIKDKKNEIDDGATATIDIETRIKLLRAHTSEIPFSHPGIQQCLQILLIETSTNNSTVYLLNKNLKKSNDFMQNLQKFKEYNRSGNDYEEIMETVTIDTREIYPTLLSFLYYLYPPMPKGPLFNSTDFKSEFESFISKAEDSIILIGEIDTAYVKVLEELSKDQDIKVKVYHPPKQDKLLIQDRNWNLIETDWRFENLHCAIVDEKEGLFSSKSFRETDYYNIIKHLNDKEVSNLINQLEGITGIKIKTLEEDIKETVSEKFPEQSGIMDLKDLENNQLKGILEYYKLNPEYSEAVSSSLGFASREDIEIGFTTRGIISRVFMNNEFEDLIKNEIKDANLVMDESSAYLLLNSSKREENVKSLLDIVRNDLWVLSEVHTGLDELLENLPADVKGRFQPIDDKNIDVEKIETRSYHLTEKEKIVIAFAKKKKDSSYGIMTNTWEVAKLCMELGINVYSLVKFLDKDEKTYKTFRIPVDLLKEV